VSDSIFHGPALNAGITSGMKIIGVNGRVYKPDCLSEAIAASRNTFQPIQLLVVADDYYKTCAIDYHGGYAIRTSFATRANRPILTRS
jgi:predicted metalloprotease with PDZ domain